MPGDDPWDWDPALHPSVFRHGLEAAPVILLHTLQPRIAHQTHDVGPDAEVEALGERLGGLLGYGNVRLIESRVVKDVDAADVKLLLARLLRDAVPQASGVGRDAVGEVLREGLAQCGVDLGDAKGLVFNQVDAACFCA